MCFIKDGIIPLNITLNKTIKLKLLKIKKRLNVMGTSVKDVIMIAVSLMVIALILPLGLGLLGLAGDTVINGTTILSEIIDPSVLTLLTVLIPILAVIGIAVSFIKSD